MKFHLLSGNVDHDIAKHIGRTTQDRLQADGVEGVRKAIAKTTYVAFRGVQLDPVIVGVEYFVAIKVIRARSRLIGLHSVRKARYSVVTDDVPGSCYHQTVIVCMRCAV